MSYSVYPNAIDSSDQLPIATDNVTPVKAEVVNRQRDAIFAIESELGTNPSGTYTTLKTRLEAVDILLATIVAGGGGSISTILDDGSIIGTHISALNFIGPGITAADAGSGRVDITVSASNQSLAQTLVFGNTTGGTSIVLSSGDDIQLAAIDGTGFSISYQGPGTSLGGAISIAAQVGTGTGAGGDVSVSAGNGGLTNGVGGSLNLAAGNATGGNATSGGVIVYGGDGFGSGVGGNTDILGGNGGATGAGGIATIAGGIGGSSSGTGGEVLVAGGQAIGVGATGGLATVRGGDPTNGHGGGVAILGRAGVGVSRTGGAIGITAGNSTNAVAGANVSITAGSSASGLGGNVVVTPGGGGSAGSITLDGYVFVNSHIIGGVSTPINPTDAANKAYVDGVGGGGEEKITFILDGVYGAFSVPGLIDPPYPINSSKTISYVTLMRRTAGASGSTTVDIFKNGTSIFGANPKPTIAFGEGNNAINTVTTFLTTTVTTNDYVDTQVIAVEGGNPADLRVVIGFAS